MSHFDCHFWAQATAHVARCQPCTLEEFKLILEDFIANMKQEDVRMAAGSVEKRAELDRAQQGERVSSYLDRFSHIQNLHTLGGE